MVVQSSELSENQACYLCNSPNIALSKKRRSIGFHKLHKYYRCGDCKSYSLFPKLEKDEIEDLYSIKYIEDVNPNFNVNEQVTENRFLNLQETLKQVENKNNFRFLDYGCGATAEVVILASNLGYQAFGVEVEVSTRQAAHLQSSCQIYSPDEALAMGDQFDIIFLGDVLEHLCDPLEILDQVQALLSQRGLLIIQGPLEGAVTISNTLLSFKARLLSKSPAKFPPYHVSLATRESIVKALKINGLATKRWQLPSHFGQLLSLGADHHLLR